MKLLLHLIFYMICWKQLFIGVMCQPISEIVQELGEEIQLNQLKQTVENPSLSALRANDLLNPTTFDVSNFGVRSVRSLLHHSNPILDKIKEILGGVERHEAKHLLISLLHGFEGKDDCDDDEKHEESGHEKHGHLISKVQNVITSGAEHVEKSILQTVAHKVEPIFDKLKSGINNGEQTGDKSVSEAVSTAEKPKDDKTPSLIEDDEASSCDKCSDESDNDSKENKQHNSKHHHHHSSK